MEALGRRGGRETRVRVGALDALAPGSDSGAVAQAPGSWLSTTPWGPALAAFQQRLTGRETDPEHRAGWPWGWPKTNSRPGAPVRLAEFGVQYDPANTEMLPAIIIKESRITAQERLFERPPASAHRDALAAAHRPPRAGWGINEWPVSTLVRAQRVTPCLSGRQLAEAAPGGLPGYARHTPQHLLASAPLHDGDSAHPAMLLGCPAPLPQQPLRYRRRDPRRTRPAGGPATAPTSGTYFAGIQCRG